MLNKSTLISTCISQPFAELFFLTCKLVPYVFRIFFGSISNCTRVHDKPWTVGFIKSQSGHTFVLKFEKTYFFKRGTRSNNLNGLTFLHRCFKSKRRPLTRKWYRKHITMCASSAKICKTQINFVSSSAVTQNGQNFLVLIIIYSVLLHPQQKSFKMFSMCTVISVLLRNMHVYLVSKRTTLKHFVYVIFICTVTCSSCSWLKLDLRCTNCKSL